MEQVRIEVVREAGNGGEPVPQGRRIKVREGEKLPPQGPVPLGSNYLTPGDLAETQRMRGARIRPLAVELTGLLHEDRVPLEDPDLRAELVALAETIREVLASGS